MLINNLSLDGGGVIFLFAFAKLRRREQLVNMFKKKIEASMNGESVCVFKERMHRIRHGSRQAVTTVELVILLLFIACKKCKRFFRFAAIRLLQLAAQCACKFHKEFPLDLEVTFCTREEYFDLLL